MPNAAGQPAVVTMIASTCTGPITAGAGGSTAGTRPGPISEEIARECQKRIENYEELLRKIDQAVANALDQAPWMQGRNK